MRHNLFSVDEAQPDVYKHDTYCMRLAWGYDCNYLPATSPTDHLSGHGIPGTLLLLHALRHRLVQAFEFHDRMNKYYRREMLHARKLDEYFADHQLLVFEAHMPLRTIK